MDNKAFNWAFIGAGGIANSVAKRITSCGRHKIVAVFNRTRERAERLAGKFGGKVYDTLEAAVCAEDTDGVYVNVTNNVHYEYCMRALECGKPVLLEKPFTTDTKQAKALFELAAARGVYLSEAMWTWFSDQANAVATAVNGGEIGKIKSALITLCLPIAFGKSSRLLKSSLAGGALLDVGVYPLTYAYRLFGMPCGIDAEARFKFDVDVDDTIILHYDGFDVTVKASIRGLRGVGERLVIIGSDGKITSGNYHSGSGFKLQSSGKSLRYPSDGNSMLTQFDRVADEIRSGKTHSEYVPPDATTDVMQILDAIRGKIGLKFSFENK